MGDQIMRFFVNLFDDLWWNAPSYLQIIIT